MKFLSIRWKIIGILIFSNIFLGLIILFVINNQVSKTLETELIERGRSIGAGMGRVAAPNILEQDVVALKQIITDALSFESVEYILIQDYDQSYLTDTYNGLIPEELTSRNVESNENPVELIQFNDDGRKCYDIVVPVEEGDLGYIRVGMMESYISNKVSATNNFIILSILVVTLAGILVTYFLANRIIKPILYLTSRANEISTGKLEEKVKVSTNDEIKDLAEAVERLRESLNMALERLKKHQTMRI